MAVHSPFKIWQYRPPAQMLRGSFRQDCRAGADRVKVLLVGGGGREHALALALAASPRCDELLCAPGNPGIAAVARLCPVAAEDVAGLEALAVAEAVDFVVVGPEAPLVGGLVDRLAARGILAFGPSAAAAQVEGSKRFTKALCDRAGIPTAGYAVFTELEAAEAYAAARPLPLVVKADGLAAGKGVTVATDRAMVAQALREALVEARFGAAGASVVIEDFLTGEEASFFALCDGTTALPLASAQDHKRAWDGDRGPNTGGMGALSPAPLLDAALERAALERMVLPALRQLAAEGTPFRGVLYAGLMVDKAAAQPLQLVEFNARFGDPECEVLLPRLRSDLLPALVAAARGDLAGIALDWSDEVTVGVVMAAEGYPGPVARGSRIDGLAAAAALPGVQVLHAATAADGEAIAAAGGRVLCIVGRGQDLAQARARAYAAVDRIDWPQGFCRRDIAARWLPQPAPHRQEAAR